MRMARVGGLAAAVVLGLALSAQAGEWGGWLRGWFAPRKKEEVRATVAPLPRPIVQPSAEVYERQRRREESALFRRQEAVLKLMEIADSTGNEDLRRQVEQLDQRAWEVYQQRTASLATGGNRDSADEAVLDKHLGGATAPTGARRGGAGTRTANLRGDQE